MRTIKRLLAILFALISLVVFAACIGGVVGVWQFKDPLLNQSTKSFDTANRILDVTSQRLKQVDEDLKQARDDLTTIKKSPVATATATRQPSLEERLASRVLAQKLGPQFDKVEQTLGLATDAAIVLNSLLKGANHLPATSVTTVDPDEVKRVRGKLSEAIVSANRLNRLLQDTPEGQQAGIADSTLEMDDLLGLIIKWVTEIRERVQRIQSDLATLKTRSDNWIQVGAVAITVVLVWFAISQLSMIASCWRWFRRQGNSPAPA